MKIIDFEEKHIADVVKINKLVFNNDPWDREQFREEINKDINYSKVVIIEERVVAFMILAFDYENLELLIIATDKNYQNRGLAKLLMNELFLIAKKVYALSIILEVGENNSKAINLYKKYNFIEIAKKENYYSDNSGIIVMQYNL